ncbi:response regulator [Diplocloster hominis]|uniref:response regulator n=1 Tax=Diplocloster hominis TaxID=3079010 RepID=UPI0031BA22E6
MKIKHKWKTLLLVILSVSLVLAGSAYYLMSVQHSLWLKSVTDVLEVTTQGRHALDTYIEKDMEMLHWLATDLSGEDSSADKAILDELRPLSGDSESSYICINLDTGTLYTALLEEARELEPEQVEVFSSLQGSGIREPYLDGRTGVWTFGYYERFHFRDGAEGLIQKSLPLSEIAERFSLSFYDDTGFSYVVNPKGDIEIRSLHRNSNRTFQNLYDIIDLQGNDPDEIQSFRTALEQGKKGVARFNYQEEDYVFCYVPMEKVPGWYLVSIVPNRVIMEQTHNIVRNSQVFLILILASGLIMAAFYLVHRNSSQQILQAEEHARRAAESANIAKSRFLSNMSHDIRTPMNAIIGMTQLASNHAAEPDKVREYLKNIELSGQLLVGLINDVLDMSKIESGKMKLQNVDTSLETLFTNLVKIIQPTAAQKNQHFHIYLHDITHEVLYFDPLRLNQVIINLLSNAVKFTPDGGTIRADITESPSARENSAHLTIRVADTGIGMKPEFLQHIFDSFSREQDDRVHQTEGTGLGMSIVKMIVDMMEGTINVASRPGEGSVFTIDLDLLLPVGPLPEDLTLPDIRVLLADSDSDGRRCAGAYLQALGICPDIVESGQAAVRKAEDAHTRREDYALVLLDSELPDLSVIETARAIRERTGLAKPVLIVSAYDSAAMEKEAADAGVNAFLQKPFLKTALCRCIRQNILHGGQPQESGIISQDLNGRRILLAEDNILNQEIAQELLEGMGARMDVVPNGLACVESFEKSTPGYYDLILMDVQMPVMNGYEATQRIRSLDRADAGTIPILAMTADAFAEDIEAALHAGMNSHLAKPLDIPAMMREIQRFLKPL